MFGFFSRTLTESTGHFVDWSRIGNLIQAGTHRYSRDELIARGSIVAFTAVSGFLKAYFNDENSSDVKDFLVGALAGFVLSHLVVVAPLVAKRCQMSQECKEIVKAVKVKVENNESGEMINKVVDHILKISLSDDHHARASQTWGHRKRLLSWVNEEVDSLDKTFWQDDIETIISKIKDLSQENKSKIRIR